MSLRFLEFLNESRKIEEKQSLIQLRDNFKKVFPYSDYENVRIISSTSKGRDTLTLSCSGIIESQSKNTPYKVLVQFHRKNLDDPWNIDTMAEVKCSCNAFRYNVAYPLYKNKNYAGRVPSNSTIPNKVVNREQIPTFCKHIYAYLRYLIQQKVISL